MAEDTTYCPYCGASMKVGATFCPSCGAQIAASQGAPAGAAPAAAAAPAYGQQYNENTKAASSAKTIGILSIILAVIGFILAITYFSYTGNVDAIYDQIKGDIGGDVTVDQAKSIIKGVFIYMGATSLILGIAGIIGGICCLRKKNYGLGLAMFIIALVVNIITLGSGMVLIGIVIAVLLLIFYTKTKPAFT